MQVAISNEESCYSMIIEKNNKKAINYVSLLVYFVSSLYRYIRTDDGVLLSITI